MLRTTASLVRVRSTVRAAAWRDLAHVDAEPVPVRRIHGDGEADPVALLVKAHPEDLKHRDPAIGRQLEGPDLIRIWRAHRDRVPVAGLIDTARLRQVSDGAALDACGLNKLGRSLHHHGHRIERGLERPWRAVDRTFLVTAYDVGAHIDPQAFGHHGVGLLDLHPGLTDVGLPA